MASNLFWREFTRNGAPDIDHPADVEFLAANFVDFFGKWLQDGQNSTTSTMDALTRAFFDKPAKYETQVFLVADGSFVTKASRPTGDWFNPHVRFLAIVTPPGKGADAFGSSTKEWTLAIVGSSLLKDSETFLQVISWNGKAFRFYQRDQTSRGRHIWNYFGNSTDAFGANAYLGPFNGHVNGSCIMKELHMPWIHWFNPSSPNDFIACLSEKNKQDFLTAPYITQAGLGLLSALTTGPDVLEPLIKNGVSNWFGQRLKADFFDASSNLIPSPAHVPRWVAHLFLTTTINIFAATMDSGGATFQIPADHFYDNELLQSASVGHLLDNAPTLDVPIGLEEYQSAIEKLRLSMLQEVSLIPGNPKPLDYLELPLSALGSDKRDERGQTAIGFRIVAENSEGQAPFNILQSSFEDAQGISKVQMLKKLGPNNWLGLFSQGTFNAIMMLDFWNPIYSWKRGILMQYVPQQTTWNGNAYDLETRFIQNVNNSSYVKGGITDSPEYQFIQLLKVDLPTHQNNISNYFNAVETYLNAPQTREQAIMDYLSLAESRRRIYRPLPLDEFGSSMPYALSIPYDSPMQEMRPDGKIQPMPARGIDFLQKWTTSLASVNPQVLPTTADSRGPLSVAALPRPSLLALPCQSSLSSTTTQGVLAARGCPYAKRNPRSTKTGCPAASASMSLAVVPAAPPRQPNWTDDILLLITEPYWIAGANRSGKASGWVAAMQSYGGWDVSKYEDVTKRAVSIYQHLRSKVMPLTDDPSDYWPEEALETFRSWANAGFPLDSSSALVPKLILPQPVEPPPTYRVRRDIMSLSKEELAVYQSKLDDVLHVGQLGSKWQELGLLHAEWCLHYQEATFLWHRAYLRYVEELIDLPIPYWNGFSTDSANPDSPFAGVPPVFFEETYISPKDGAARPNPLKYALSLNGVSKDPKNQFVTRDPVLVQGKSAPGWASKIALFGLYHDQISHSLSQKTFTSSDTAEGFGLPWQNIPEFSENNPDSNYPFRLDFDGLFEQVHDNFHGWVGPDMADNTYTAFDPIFLSYHANMDRLTSIFLDSRPTNQLTARFPLQPFLDSATRLSYDDPRRWIYTTIGDMAKDTRALGYTYAPPASSDALARAEADLVTASSTPQPAGGRAISLPSRPRTAHGTEAPSRSGRSSGATKKIPYVVFTGVGCTPSGYRIDVFAPEAASLVPDPAANPDFIGQVTRLGMGPGRPGGGGRGGERCRKSEVMRVLSAERYSDRLGGGRGDGGRGGLKVVVTDLESGKEVGPEEVKALSGFEPVVIWLSV